MHSDFSNRENGHSEDYNYRKYFIFLLSRWYWVLPFLVIAMGSAYLFNRSVPKKYNLEALITFKKESTQYESRVDRALKNLNMLGNFEQFDQESDIELMQSYHLIRNTLEKLNFEISYHREGNLYDQELYKSSPFYAEVDLSPAIYRHPVKIQMLSPERYKVVIDQEFYVEEVMYFGEKFSKRGLEFTLYKNLQAPDIIKEGDRYYFQVHKLEDLTKRYQDKLKINRQKEESNIIRISSVGKVPEKERDFINALIESYKIDQFNRTDQNADASIEFIKHNVEKIDNRLLRYQNELQGLQMRRSQIRVNTPLRRYSESFIDPIANASSYLYEKLSTLENEKKVLMDTREDFIYFSELIKNNRNIDSIFLPITGEFESVSFNELIQELANIQNQINASQQNIKDNHPYYRSLHQQYQEQKENLLTKVNLYIDHLDKSISRVEREMDKIKEEIPSNPYKERRYSEMLRKIGQNEKILEILSEKRIEFELIKASKTPDFNILKEPRVTDAIVVYPKSMMNYVIAFFIGFLVPGTVLILKKSASQKIEEKEDIWKNTSIPILHALEHNVFKTDLPVYYYPQSSVTEGFRYIRKKIASRLKSYDHKILMVSSMLSGEGKTYVSANLGAILAMGGNKTVIVSADIRKHPNHSIFSVKSKLGLSDYFTDHSDIENIIQPLPVRNLFIIPPGKPHHHVGDQFSEKSFSFLLNYLVERFEYILFDSPPFSIFPESMTIAERCHCNIFLVRHNYTPRSTIDSFNDLNREGKLSNIFLLVNGIKKLKGLGFEYHFGYETSYGFGYYNKYYYHSLNNKRFSEYANMR